MLSMDDQYAKNYPLEIDVIMWECFMTFDLDLWPWEKTVHNFKATGQILIFYVRMYLTGLY